MSDVVSIDAVRAAAERIRPHVVRTPTLAQPRLSELIGRQTVAKLELLQHSGAFKVRGAFNRMLALSDAERAAGAVAVSGGNHGLAVAYVGRALGVRATVVMPETTALSSIAGVQSLGAELILTPTIGEAFDEAHKRAVAGQIMIHPFDDPVVIAGQGTVGLELMADAPQITDVVASIGGGGMITGVATAVHSVNPEIRVWGVETEGADSMTRALAAGHPVEMKVTSIAKTLGPPAVSERTLAGVRQHVTEVIVVSDADAVRGIELLAEHVKVITEPAAACTLIAAQRIADRLPADAHVALVLCGGNSSLDDITRWRTELLGR
jgi:threonine dehydratase